LDGIAFPTLSGDDNVSLTMPFTLEEIEVVVMESDGNKSLGPDGYNFNFVKNFWSLLKNEVRILFDQFHGNSCLPKSFMSYFVALIPKVLARRLARVMDLGGIDSIGVFERSIFS
jgi:hypothetical protein